MPEDNHPEMTESDNGAETAEIQLLFNHNEEKIMNATIKAFESGSLTPLIKEELRCTIQSRRLAAGQGELKVEEFKKPPKKMPVTDEEKKRAQTRRVQNREAAQRFRQRQKDQAGFLTEKIKRLEKTSASLLGDIKLLRLEKDELMQMVQNHMAVCTNNVHISSVLSPSHEQFFQLCVNPSTSSGDLSIATSQCPDTSDSTSSVFFPDEVNCEQNNHLTYGSLLQDLEEHTIQFTQDNGGMMQELMEAPEMGQEMVIGDNDLSDSLSEYSDDHRLDSCSSFETVSNYSSVSDCSPSDLNSELNATLASTFAMVHMAPFSSQPFLIGSYVAGDILLLDDNTS